MMLQQEEYDKMCLKKGTTGKNHFIFDQFMKCHMNINMNTVSGENRLDIFVCGDQIRKGAALNAVQIAELLLQNCTCICFTKLW